MVVTWCIVAFLHSANWRYLHRLINIRDMTELGSLAVSSQYMIYVEIIGCWRSGSVMPFELCTQFRLYIESVRGICVICILYISMVCVESQAVFLCCCPDCPSCLLHESNIG